MNRIFQRIIILTKIYFIITPTYPRDVSRNASYVEHAKILMRIDNWLWMFQSTRFVIVRPGVQTKLIHVCTEKSVPYFTTQKPRMSIFRPGMKRLEMQETKFFSLGVEKKLFGKITHISWSFKVKNSANWVYHWKEHSRKYIE